MPIDEITLRPADAVAQSPPTLSLTIRLSTVVRFLFGSRDAILTLASHRQTVRLGLVCVLSAGTATSANLSFLAVVSFWRVLRMPGARVASRDARVDLLRSFCRPLQIT